MERIAHRGAKLEFPENSLPAFERAFARGANAIELDVHATRDGMVVVHHDAALGDYAKDLAGAAIAGLDWAVLSAVEIAPGIQVPRLADVLGATPPTATVYVEIKGTGIEAQVVAAVRSTHARCAVHSFDHDAVACVGELAPELRRGILFDRRGLDVVAAMRKTGAKDVWPKHTLIDRTLVEHVQGEGGRVIAWTVNSYDEAKALGAIGVAGICTDDVRLLDGL